VTRCRRDVQVCARVAGRPPAQKVLGPVDFSIPEENCVHTYIRAYIVRACRPRACLCARECARRLRDRGRTRRRVFGRVPANEDGRGPIDRPTDRPTDSPLFSSRGLRGNLR